MSRTTVGFGVARRVIARLLVAALTFALAIDSGRVVHASGSIQLLSSSSWTDSIGNIHIVGEVQNNTGTYQDFIQITFDYFDASGSLLKPDFTFTNASELAPGERGGFTDIFTPPAGYDHYSITGVSGSTTSSPPNHNFATVVTNVFTDSIGAQHIVGTVTNNNSTTDTFVEVVFTFYGCSGTTVDTDFTFVQAPGGSSTVNAGQTAPFELIRLSESPAMTTVRLFTESSDAPSPYILPGPTLNPTPPAVTNVNATPGVGLATVSWSPPACVAYFVTSYTITPFVGSAAQPSLTAGALATSTIIHNLTNGTTYTFTVAANNDAGTGAASVASNPVTPADVPGAPTNVTATAGNAAANLSWAAPTSDGGSPLTGYTVTSSPGSITVSVGNSTTSAIVTGLTNGTTYTFTVRATNAIGSGPASLPSNAITPAGPPTAPLNAAALGSESSATVYWSPPATNGGVAISSYTVTSAPGGVTATTSGSATTAIVTGLMDGTDYTFTVTATNSVGTSPQSAMSNLVTPGRGQYHPLSPVRILDTRDGTGGVPKAPLGANSSMNAQVTGQGGVPSSGVAAVVLNVTVTNPTSPSYLTVWPTGIPRPLASNLNFVAGQSVPNLVEVAVGLNGQLSVYNAYGSTDVIFDVAGYVATPTAVAGPDGLNNPVVPFRILDTRNGTGAPQAPIGPNQTITVQVTGMAGSNVPANGVAAVILNVTVTNPTAASYLTVFPAGATRPVVSNLNFVAGQTVPNRVIVKVGTNGSVSIYNAAGNVHVIADIGGWFTDGVTVTTGSRFVGVIPARILDTRDGTAGVPIAPLGANASMPITVAGRGGVPAMNAATPPSAVVLNVTVTNPRAGSYLTVWPDGPTRPLASDLNYGLGLTVPNLVVVKLGSNGMIDLYNAYGSVDVIIDVVGWYG